MKMNFLSELFANVGNVTWQHAVIVCVSSRVFNKSQNCL